MTVVEFLVSKGFHSEVRDRLFRTPLHIACLHGFTVISEFLIRNNLESIISQDLRGRTCAHFASCAPTSDCLNIIALYNKDVYKMKDFY